MSKEIPMGVALMLCDRVITDAVTQEKTLVATFSQLHSMAFPCMHPRLTVFVAVTNGKGAIDTEVRCINETEQNSVVFAMKGMIQFNHPNDVVEMGFQFNNLVFNKPGLHSIQFLCEGELVLQRRFQLSIFKSPAQPK
jgi:hypothetical protein